MIGSLYPSVEGDKTGSPICLCIFEKKNPAYSLPTLITWLHTDVFTDTYVKKKIETIKQI